ncbi:ABC transporter ATP-binding protein [Streptomyces canus]|uniref:ABC transporter ATP-binding protein n=1 Tax=Streptomyces canus TaxID=58343 RepID=UPI00277F4003|nr:ABC transporter ATP-binding protein [Streptomyces canus]MDQ0767087.1 putative ABC transport system ATP-binding protein [Streptomyces canus]MDQ1065124.1 putative ABC transport system ATP-binding protein [Streptomyces canus]
MNEHLLEIRNLSKVMPAATSQAPVPVLRGISLDVARGEFVAIVGPSGSGKSTLLYCMSGLQPPTEGTVRLLGNDLSALDRKAQARLRRDHVGFVFQSYNLIPSLTASENVALPARLARRKAGLERVDAALAAVGLSGQAQQKPGTLSGGQQQRVAIARVLAMSPDIVFADEPTGALDTEAGTQVLALLRDTAAQDCSVVMVTHDLQAAARADRVLVLRDGAVHHELLRPSAEEVFDAVTDRGSQVA